MDRTSIIILAVCVALLLVMQRLVDRAFPPKPVAQGATNAVATAQTTTTTTNTAVAPPATPSGTLAPPSPVRFIADADVPEQLLVVSNENARYTFTSHGGGLKLVELVRYPESTPSRPGRRVTTKRVATLNTRAPVPTLALLDGEGLQGDGIFSLAPTPGGVRAEKALTNGLTIIKDFQLGTNYLLTATVRLENRAAQPLVVPAQEWVVGTATPMSADDKGQVLGAMWYNGQKMESVDLSYFTPGFSCVPRSPHAEYRAGASNVVWAAVQNQFFTLAAVPQGPALQIVARSVNLPRPPDDETATLTNGPPPHGVQTTIVYPAVTVAPNETLERTIHCFAGPKEYRTLAKLGDRFNNNLDLVMGYGGFFGFFAKALLLAMNWLNDAARLSYGWAIIAITVIIKLLFWPLTQASTRSMKRMQALQPQMKAIQEKFKDDPVKMNRKTMEFMKEHKVSPLGGCLPMLIQLPIFFGFFTMIRSAIELRGARFLWVPDLSKPDTLFVIPGLDFIPLITTPGAGLPVNLLPLLMGGTMLWQSHLTPASPGMDPMQQKIMRYMPLMFLVFLYNFSAGLTLYWTVQNLLTIAQMKLTRTQPATGTAAAAATVPAAPSRKK